MLNKQDVQNILALVGEVNIKVKTAPLVTELLTKLNTMYKSFPDEQVLEKKLNEATSEVTGTE